MSNNIKNFLKTGLFSCLFLVLKTLSASNLKKTGLLMTKQQNTNETPTSRVIIKNSLILI
jgi:hypothetical protein